MRVSFILFLIASVSFNLNATDGIKGKISLKSNKYSAKAEDLIFNKETLLKIIAEKKSAHFVLGQTKQSRNVEAWFFPGSSDNNALVIGGVHGSELSSVEVAKALISQLTESRNNYYNVIIIPSLFPDNASRAVDNPLQIGTTANVGRYTFCNSVDPNRQMPSPGKAFDDKTGLDHLGRKIETENQLLLQLIQSFRPQRIINVHAIRDTSYGGVYADPRTDQNGIALGYTSDSSLAVSIAKYIAERGGNVGGNHLAEGPTALYYKDPVPAPAAYPQKRNMTGSVLNANRGSGVSLGTWASTAVMDDENPSNNREAMRILTMEYPGYKRPVDYARLPDKAFQQRQVESYASAIQSIFLGNYFVEDKAIDLAKTFAQ